MSLTDITTTFEELGHALGLSTVENICLGHSCLLQMHQEGIGGFALFADEKTIRVEPFQIVGKGPHGVIVTILGGSQSMTLPLTPEASNQAILDALQPEITQDFHSALSRCKDQPLNSISLAMTLAHLAESRPGASECLSEIVEYCIKRQATNQYQLVESITDFSKLIPNLKTQIEVQELAGELAFAVLKVPVWEMTGNMQFL